VCERTSDRVGLGGDGPGMREMGRVADGEACRVQ
jgi:hypothetical protein